MSYQVNDQVWVDAAEELTNNQIEKNRLRNLLIDSEIFTSAEIWNIIKTVKDYTVGSVIVACDNLDYILYAFNVEQLIELEVKAN